MTCPARVCPGVSAGVSDMPAETLPLEWMTVQVSGEIYLPPGDPGHGVTMTLVPDPHCNCTASALKPHYGRIGAAAYFRWNKGTESIPAIEGSDAI